MSFKEYKLGEIYDISSGLSKGKEEFGFGYPFLTFKDVFYNYFIPEELTSLANTSEKERQNCSVLRGDLFLTRTSETLEELGMGAVALKDYPNATFNGFTKRLRPKTSNVILPEYAGFYFRSRAFRNQINCMAVMTTRASLNNSMIEKLTISLPEMDEQQRIAQVLLALMQKIEVNNQITKTLETMAQALFKQWFVDFEFPNENGEPYKSSGGEMVESELGLIPKGWAVSTLGEIIEILDSKRIPLSKNEREKHAKIYPYYGAAALMDYVDDYIFEGIHVLMGEDGTVIDENGYPILQYVWGKFWVNNHAHVLKGINGVSEEFILILLKNLNIKSAVTGAVQLKVNQQNMKSLKIVLPTDLSLIEKFTRDIEKSYEMLRNCCDENAILKSLREILLPKLMSGEIRVPM